MGKIKIVRVELECWGTKDEEKIFICVVTSQASDTTHGWATEPCAVGWNAAARMCCKFTGKWNHIRSRGCVSIFISKEYE